MGKKPIKNHWSKIAKAGDFKHGLDFSFEQNFKNGELASLRNNLMKYLVKTFVETIPVWTPEDLVFNAIVWKEGYRFFGCSCDLSKAMKRLVEDNTTYTWFQTSMHRPDRGHEEDKIIQKKPMLKTS